MNTHEAIRLNCSPEPLLYYLKALGIQRVVAEQVDPQALGFWRAGSFYLQSALTAGELEDFFLSKWVPTPLISPWNGGSGFWDPKRAAGQALERVRASKNPRLAPYRETIRTADQIIASLGLEARPEKDEKQALLRRLRNRMPDDIVRWMDVVCVLTDDAASYFPILGSGANDGNLDFTSAYVQRLEAVIPYNHPDERTIQTAQEWLQDSLFATGTPRLLKEAVGQFHPGGAGGPNAGLGFASFSLVNPWDYLFGMEGILLFAGALSRRHGSSSPGTPSFPFTVNETAAGTGTYVDADTRSGRKEVWVPLWERPTTLIELRHTFSEGRAQVGTRIAQSGVDFARAIAELGVDRGIAAFKRYGFLQRNGLAYLATPLGDIRVQAQPHANLLRELDAPWFARFRQLVKSGGAAARHEGVLRSLDDAMMAYCKHGTPRHLEDVLIAVGRMVHALALSPRMQEHLDPLQSLTPRWTEVWNGGASLEFHLALSLAAIDDEHVGPIRQQLEPVTKNDRGRFVWLPNSPSAVWGGGPLEKNLGNVLERRCLDSKADSRAIPVFSKHRVDTDLVQMFLHRTHIDEGRLTWLLWALATIRWGQPSIRLPAPNLSQTGIPLDRSYALLKMLFHHERLTSDRNPNGILLKPDTAILYRLRRGDLSGAANIAVRKLRNADRVPLGARQGTSGQLRAPEFVLPSDRVRRLPAALLFSIKSHWPLLRVVLPPRSSSLDRATEAVEA